MIDRGRVSAVNHRQTFDISASPSSGTARPGHAITVEHLPKVSLLEMGRDLLAKLQIAREYPSIDPRINLFVHRAVSKV